MKTILLLALLWLPAAQAYINEPYIDPPNPDSKSVVELIIETGGCHVVYGDPSFVQLIKQNVIDIKISVIEQQGFLCNYPQLNFFHDIGVLAEGEYTLHLYKHQDVTPPVPDELIYTIQLRVSRAPALPVPLLNGWGLAVLALSLMLLGGWWYRRLQVRDEV